MILKKASYHDNYKENILKERLRRRKNKIDELLYSLRFGLEKLDLIKEMLHIGKFINIS